MKQITKEVYYCEHCDYYSLTKGVVTKHEKHCAHNPQNKHACLDCVHLEKIKVDVEFDYYGYPQTKTVEKYHCKALDKMLHSF